MSNNLNLAITSSILPCLCVWWGGFFRLHSSCSHMMDFQIGGGTTIQLTTDSLLGLSLTSLSKKELLQTKWCMSFEAKLAEPKKKGNDWNQQANLTMSCTTFRASYFYPFLPLPLPRQPCPYFFFSIDDAHLSPSLLLPFARTHVPTSLGAPSPSLVAATNRRGCSPFPHAQPPRGGVLQKAHTCCQSTEAVARGAPNRSCCQLARAAGTPNHHCCVRRCAPQAVMVEAACKGHDSTDMG